MSRFDHETYLPFARDDVFAWYTRRGALTRLHPPFAGEVLAEPEDGPVNGAESQITLNLPGLFGASATAAAGLAGSVLPFSPRSRLAWHSRHEDFRPGHGFTDVMISGPMHSWRHEREFLDQGQGTLLRETITYQHPAESRLPGPLRRRIQNSLEQELHRVFTFRAHQTAQDLAFHQSHGRLASQQRERRSHLDVEDDACADGPQVVAVSGASGMIGTQVCALLGGAGIEVRRLVRRDLSRTEAGESETGVGEIAWDPDSGQLDEQALADVDVVINLAGRPLASRFTDEHKRRVRSSRVDGTTLLAETLAHLEETSPRGRALISGSAIGWYGATAQDRVGAAGQLTESMPSGTDFLAEVCRAWESAARRAETSGVRVATIRTGLVQSPSGGALQQMLPLFAVGVGGPLGGPQMQSWISLDDIAGLIVHLALTPSARGPVNGVAPAPVTARAYARCLGAVLRRPSALPTPSFGPKLLLGAQGSRELVMADQNASAEKALDLGYAFRHPTLEEALRHVLGR
ncbi:TIGR01777 family oxidoreductase [Nesterenkonia xinjiangensis]|uniref:TIGR01777 family protein n=1 Tax=Nesterenkonia xinjiangensis TaxID=225327 RepID=A0A7Z0KCZ6_9MICC|nr:TIGR01777 family oxidoreductase [Nesterenkonia xinjiangensis]NYJ79132.1 hypothetical protein [Nesterenkonia xinjiangensis]